MNQAMKMILQKLYKVLFSQKALTFFQSCGINLTLNNYYSPIPNIKRLAEKSALWENEQKLPGVKLNAEKQLWLLENIFSKYRDECNFPLNKPSEDGEYYINNGAFGFLSAASLHCLIRHYKPRTIIEVGSGNSTLVSTRACLMNKKENDNITKLISIEPYPCEILKKDVPGLSELIIKRVEEVDGDLFSKLHENDILFIDSTHVVRVGGDVNFLYLEVLPKLQKGVIIHVHDIFFPYHYPKDWVIKKQLFWNEQYLLQAFLMFNDYFEVLWCCSYMYSKYLDRVTSVLPPPHGLGLHENYFSSSFWMRKIK